MQIDNGPVAVATRSVWRFALCYAMLTTIAPAQINSSQSGKAPVESAKDNLAEATSRVKDGNFFPADVDLIAKTRGVQAIPDFKDLFERTKDELSKASVASALVQLGDKDPAAWDYLVQGASDAIDTDSPSQFNFDQKGKLIPGPSSDFIAWAKRNNLTTANALGAAMLTQPAKLAFLADTEDRRAIPILRQALLSSNFMIQGFASRGLAKLHDKASIPLIIQACREAPADAAMAIAMGLLDFDDPLAQIAAKSFRPESDPK